MQVAGRLAPPIVGSDAPRSDSHRAVRWVQHYVLGDHQVDTLAALAHEDLHADLETRIAPGTVLVSGDRGCDDKHQGHSQSQEQPLHEPGG